MASSVAASVTSDYADSPLGTKIEVTLEQKDAVRTASDGGVEPTSDDGRLTSI